MKLATYLDHIRAGKHLDRMAAGDFLGELLDEKATQEQMAKALTLLTKKGVNAQEVQGFIDAMRTRMLHVRTDVQAIDVCGTGGDQSGTFNISTAAAIVLAAGGVPVAKHGNRSASSKCGSADVLEALNIPVDFDPPMAAQQLSQKNFVFLFAQKYHPALKQLAVVRKSLGFPTVFNLLGPLLNPVGVKRQVMGTFSVEYAQLLAEIASGMGYEHALVIVSQDGLDEASLSAPTHLFELRDQRAVESRIKPADYGLAAASIADLQGGDAATNARLIAAALQPTDTLSAHQRVIVLNAGLGYYVSGRAGSIGSGVELAASAVRSGDAAAKLEELSKGTT